MNKNKQAVKKPQKVLIPVIFLIASNLIIYLYIIATGVNVLDLLPYNSSKINDYLIIGSYFISTFTMLLTLTAYFNVSADIKRLIMNYGVEPQSNFSTSPDVDNLSRLSDSKVIDTAKPLDINKNSDNNEHKQVIVNEELKNKKSDQKLKGEQIDKISVISDKVESKGWKKIGVKIIGASDNEKSEDVIPDADKVESPDNDIINSEEPVIEEETETVDNETLQEVQTESESDDEIEEIIAENIEDNIINNDDVDNITNEIKQNGLENNIQASLMEDSEVLKNLEELKMMVDDMKVKLEKRKYQRK